MLVGHMLLGELSTNTVYERISVPCCCCICCCIWQQHLLLLESVLSGAPLSKDQRVSRGPLPRRPWMGALLSSERGTEAPWCVALKEWGAHSKRLLLQEARSEELLLLLLLLQSVSCLFVCVSCCIPISRDFIIKDRHIERLANKEDVSKCLLQQKMLGYEL